MAPALLPGRGVRSSPGHFTTVNSRAPRFFDPRKSCTLFLRANPDKRRRLFSDYVPLAICPREAINYEFRDEPMVPPWPGRAARP